MGALKLELKLSCPNNINGITLDPKPDWSLDDLVNELKSLEMKRSVSSNTPIFTKTEPREFERANKSTKPFVMRISDDEDSETDNEEYPDPNLVVGKRFACSDLYVSDTDSSGDELALEETQAHLMEPEGLFEGLLVQREIEHYRWAEEDIRHTIDLLEMDLINENEKSTLALLQLDKLKEARREMDRKVDTQYRRKIAEKLDNHLIALQRNHEHKSQIEERKIRNDAEEAKKIERALQEERARQEKAKAEAEAAQRKAEETKKEALEAERHLAKEAEEKKANEAKNIVSREAGQNATRKIDGNLEESIEVKDRGTMIRASERALKIASERLQKYNEIIEKNHTLKSSSNTDFRQYETQIGRHVKQIAGTQENVRTKANELIKIINDPKCPQSISIAMFAKKIVSQNESLTDSTAFARGHVAVLVTSQVPLAMDPLLAEFYTACIYTIPKYIVKSESGLAKEGYLKALGYQEEDGKMETTEQYLSRVELYMKLYGALVQTEINGARNLHGLEEGWAWLARLLNALPANIYTAVALEAFLKMAGFKLFRRYKSQFKKILNLISTNFVGALEAQKDPNPKLNLVVNKIKTYIGGNLYLNEPEGSRMQVSLLSVMGVPDTDSGFHQNQYYHQSNRW